MAQKLNKTQLVGTESSTSEINTGEKWVDGRPIFKKTIIGTVTLINGSSNLAHGIPDFTTSFQILSVQGSWKIGVSNGINGGSQSIYYRETGGNWAHYVLVNATNIRFNSSFAWGATYTIMTLTYVK